MSKKYIALFETARPLTKEDYPGLHTLLEGIPNGVRFSDSVIAFAGDGSCEEVRDSLLRWLGEDDRVVVFELSDAAWRVNGSPRELELRRFLESE